jgi:hypothetical protein
MIDAPAFERRVQVGALMSRLLDSHAQLAAGAAIARLHGLERCATSLTRQHMAISTEILALVADLTAPLPSRLESFV